MLTWHDGVTGMPAARLLRVLLPLLPPGPLTLADDPPRKWADGLGQLMHAVELLLDQAAPGDGAVEKKDCMLASVEIVETVLFVGMRGYSDMRSSRCRPRWRLCRELR